MQAQSKTLRPVCRPANAQVIGYDRVLASADDAGRFTLFLMDSSGQILHLNLLFSAGQGREQMKTEDELFEALGTNINRLKGWYVRLAFDDAGIDKLVGVGHLFQNKWFCYQESENSGYLAGDEMIVREQTPEGWLSHFGPLNMQIEEKRVTDTDSAPVAIVLKLNGKGVGGCVDFAVSFTEENMHLVGEAMRQIRKVAGVKHWDSVDSRFVRVMRREAGGEIWIGHINRDDCWFAVSMLEKNKVAKAA